MAANLAAIAVVRTLQDQDRPATPSEQDVLAGWSSWGALPEVFERWRPDWARTHLDFDQALTPSERDAASATTLNAHYTDPAIVEATWSVLSRAGLDRGLVLEPGCGSGTFIGLAPAGVQMVGVELDPMTAQIAAALYPGAQVRNEGFQDSRLGSAERPVFDAAVGNVPFGNFSLHDPMDNPLGLSIHNHFLGKALARVRPGGYVVILTSSFTMDASRSTARAWLNRTGELLGAIRLPTGAFARVAGTDVVTDLLVLRRRTEPPTGEALHPTWLGTSDLTVEGHEDAVAINDYFAQNPQHVLGSLNIAHGMHGAATLVVNGARGADLAEQLRTALEGIVERARTQGKALPTPSNDPVPSWWAPGLAVPALEHEATPHGHVREITGGFAAWSVPAQEWEPVKVARPRAAETRHLLRLRDAAVAVIDSQTTAADEATRLTARRHLHSTYDTYSATYGAVNRFTRLPGRTPTQRVIADRYQQLESTWRQRLDDDASAAARAVAEPPADLIETWRELARTPGDPVHRQEHLTALRADPDFALVCALEHFDPDTQRAVKAQIFDVDVVHPAARPTSAATAADALAIALDETRTVDLARIAELLDVSPAVARARLADLVFDDHVTGDLIPAELYLSGNVRARLAAVRQAAVENPALAVNVAALEDVLPVDIPLEDVTIRPGAHWVGPALHEEFLRTEMGIRAQVTLSVVDGAWEIDGPSRAGIAPGTLFRFGTDDRTPLELLAALMNNRPVAVWRTERNTDGSTRRYQDVAATAAAKAKAEQIERSFGVWVGADVERARAAGERYNRAFNSRVAPDFSAAGQRLALPGLSPTRTPHPYQRSAVAQVISSPAVLLDHVVGAGKTGTMIMSAMELRRLGVARKPWVVVPNHLVDQIAAEWRTWYPAAAVLAIPTGIDAAGRREWVARSAAGDWDAVICPATVFKRVNVEPSRAGAWLAEDIATLRDALVDVTSSRDTARVKAIERVVKRKEAEYEVAMSGKDTGLTFEQTGCDYLFVDEAHHFKNLARASAVPDLAHIGSQQATDLDFKLRALREAKTEAGSDELASTATFATGTPVANSLAEMWVMQHYLRPDLLTEAGATSIDAWARQFARVETKLELGPDAVTWRNKDRVAGFVNVPELMALSDQFTSVVTAEHLTAAVPSLVGGARRVVERAPSPAVRQYVTELAHRAAHLPKDPSIDNRLKITGDGRMVALDPRLRGLPADTDGGRVADIADAVMSIHAATKDTIYLDALGRAHPTPGGLQLVFCDSSTPTKDGSWNIYHALRANLIDRGMPAGAVRFIHEATNDAEREELFASCRDGRTSVLIGSTAKMGTGTNVQARAVALHHADCPWRPADLEQREGRLLRQGNQNTAVHVNNYVTTRTYDAVVWQYVYRKAAFIAQMKSGQATGRTITDVGDDMVISAAAAQAIATGDPRVMRRAELLEQVTALENLERGWHNERAAVRRTMRRATSEINEADIALPLLRRAQAIAQPTSGNAFAFTTTHGQVMTARADAGEYLVDLITRLRRDGANSTLNRERLPLGTLGALVVRLVPGWTVRLELASAPDLLVEIRPHEDPSTEQSTAPASSVMEPLGLVRRLEHAVASVDTAIERTWAKKTRAQATLDELTAALEADTTFDRAAELATARAELATLSALLELGDDSPEPTTADPEPDRLHGDELANTLREDGTARGHTLRAGDVVVDGTGTKRRLLQVTEPETDTRRVSARETSAPSDAPDERLGRNKSYTVVSRLASTLTPLEALARNLAPTDKATAQLGEFRIGTRVTVAGKEADLANPWGPPTGPMQLVTGTIVERRDTAVVIETDAGERTTIKPVAPTGVIVAIGHGVVAPGQERALSPDAFTFGRLLPGDLATFTDYDGEHCTLLAADSAHTTELVVPTTGECAGNIHRDTNRIMDTVTPGRTLTDDEFTAVFGEDPHSMRVGDLRPGDVVRACDLDPTTRSSEHVQIRTISSYGSMRDVTHRHLQDAPGAPATALRRRENSPIRLVSRRYGALREHEVRTLIDPRAHLVSRADLPLLAAGTPVWWGDPNAGATPRLVGTFDHLRRDGRTVLIDTDTGRKEATLNRDGHLIAYPHLQTPPPLHIDRSGGVTTSSQTLSTPIAVTPGLTPGLPSPASPGQFTSLEHGPLGP